MSIFEKIVLLLRMSHWSKSFFVFLGVIYSPTPGDVRLAVFAALAFCFTASAVYIYNDLQDREEDKAHPKKSHRPLASGVVSVRMAWSTLVFCLLIGLCIGMLVSAHLADILIAYLLVNLFYNHGLRDIPFIDVLCIASGFLLRILAGTIGIGLPMTWWLMMTATLLSLYIALSKRRLEIQLGSECSKRAVLRQYHPGVLNGWMAGAAISCFLGYFLYTICVREEGFYFLLTLPFSAFGLWRFFRLTQQETHNDDPLSLFFHDTLSCLNLLCFFVLTIMALSQ
jgi:4-hydroxybenzoate polyprenyltransferase